MLDVGMHAQELSNGLRVNHSFLLKVRLVSNQDKWEFFRRLWMTFINEVAYPSFDIIERLNDSLVTL
jgi:hypothetical protein